MSNLNYFFANAEVKDDAVIKLRDDSLVVFKRAHSKAWQCRFKLANGKWHSATTNTESIEQAKVQALAIYESAQIKVNVGLAVSAKTFKQIALDELDNMRRALNAGVAKTCYRDYEFVIHKYLIPFFGKYEIKDNGDDSVTVTYSLTTALTMPVPDLMRRKVEKSTIEQSLSELKQKLEG